MAKEALVVSVQVLSCGGSGTLAGVIAGINWALSDALQQPQKAVISMSLGGPQSQSENDAVANAHARGVVVVVAAGNDAGNACLGSPASGNRHGVGTCDSLTARHPLISRLHPTVCSARCCHRRVHHVSRHHVLLQLERAVRRYLRARLKRSWRVVLL